MSISQDTKRQFTEYTKLQAMDHRFIDKDRERKILEEGVMRFGIPLDDGRAIMLGCAAENGFAVERDAEAKIKVVLERFAANRGRIDRRQFEDAVAIYKSYTNGHLRDAEVRARLKRIMEDNGWRPKRAGLFRSRKWFNGIQAG
ncbi:MAG: hypothetical protein OHK0024_18400 [Thalassobaculales bacterium]